LVAHLVDDDRVGPSDVGDFTHDHGPRRTDQRRVIQRQQDHLLKTTAIQVDSTIALLERHGPGDPRHAPDRADLPFGQQVEIVNVKRLGRQDPDRRVLNVTDLSRAHAQHPTEDRALLAHQHRGEGDAENHGHVLRPAA
jgi:hypothetical protein